MRESFPTLFSPIKIGSMEIKNRVVMAPMANYMSDDTGAMNEAQIAFLERRARGGTGLLVLGSLYIQHPIARFGVGQLGIYDDGLIPGYREMVAVVHDRGAKIAAQLHHAGRATTRAAIKGEQPVAPSPIPLNVGKYVDLPRELSKTEIDGLVHLYADAARRCKQAGFDGIEVHMAHGYLPCQFLSPFSNKRSDEYGGDVHGRTRFPREIFQAVRAAVGPDFPIWCRIVGDELQGDAGLQVEDMKVIAKLLVEAGAQAISVSRGMAPFYHTVMGYRFDEGCMVDLAEAIKSVVDVPVFTAGRITTPAFAEQVLMAGRADLVALGRGLICDPDWANKAAAGAPEDIRPCLGCNLGCHDPKRRVRHTICLSNADCGREQEFELVPSPRAKRVLVVGGGPAGLEAARVAQLRGHQVTLVEAQPRLGGQLHLGSIPPYKDGLELLIAWWQRQVEQAGVRLELGRRVSVGDVRGWAPDVVVVATGSRPLVPAIPGVDLPSVVTAHAVLAGDATVGSHVLVIGGGQTGAETAEWLALAGKTVTVVEMLAEIATNVPPDAQYFIKQSLAALGVRVLTSTEVETIEATRVRLRQVRDGTVWTTTLEPVDHVVLAVGLTSESQLAEALRPHVPEVYVVGDAAAPGHAMDAVHQAAAIAREF